MLSAVKNAFKKGGGDVAGLQAQIANLKAEGAAALAEIDRLQAERCGR